MPESASPGELPLACSLGPGDGAARQRRWRQLAHAAAPAAVLAGHQLEVRYRPGPGVLEELRSLARAENECAVTEQAGNRS